MQNAYSIISVYKQVGKLSNVVPSQICKHVAEQPCMKYATDRRSYINTKS